MKSLFYNFSVIALSAAFAWSGAANQDPDNCENVQFEGVAQLGFLEVAPGVIALGALPTPVTIAGVPGFMSSFITGVRSSGAKGQGAQHYTLMHTFISTDPARPGGFSTEDRAVAAPAGKDPNVSIINDVLTIVSGEGIFENATGFMMNHAIVDLTEFTLTFSTHGRICGADFYKAARGSGPGIGVRSSVHRLLRSRAIQERKTHAKNFHTCAMVQLVLFWRSKEE